MESATWLLCLENATAALSAHPRASQICDIRNSRVNGRQPSGLNKNNLDCGISLFSGGGGGGGGGAYARDKDTSAGLWAKNAGGGLCARGWAYLRDLFLVKLTEHYLLCILFLHFTVLTFPKMWFSQKSCFYSLIAGISRESQC